MLAREYAAIGMSGKAVCLHSSLRSFTKSRFSPQEIINAFLEIDATLIVPTQAWSVFSAPKPEEESSIPFNAESDGSIPAKMPEEAFDISSPLVGKAMGSIPRVLLQEFPRIRGNHPLASFAGLGGKSGEIIEGQNPNQPFTPLEKLVENEGYIFLMGTDLTSATLLHLGEYKAGLPLLRRWALTKEHWVIKCEVSGCSRGFAKLNALFSDIEIISEFEGSKWRVFPARQMLEIATSFFKQDPLGGVCDDVNCVKCNARRDYVSAKRSHIDSHELDKR